jgi:hypothetical protein
MILKRVAKSAVALVVLVLLATSVGIGQTRKHDLSLSCGFVTSDQFADAFTDFLTIVITLGTFGKQAATYSPVPFFTYHYAPKSRFGFGLAFGGYVAEGDLELLGDPVGSFKETNIIAAVEIDYHWLMKKGVQLYSGAGFGLRFRRGTYDVDDATDTLSQTFGTVHLNLLGFRVGRSVGFFGEIGVGYKGLLNLGLNAQF